MKERVRHNYICIVEGERRDIVTDTERYKVGESYK